MVFEPAPENDFAEFIETYYEQCRRVVPEIEAIGGKWEFEDLLPGMSDFDYRFIYADGMTAEDWCRAADAAGRQQGDELELARQAVEICDGFYHVLHKLGEKALEG